MLDPDILMPGRLYKYKPNFICFVALLLVISLNPSLGCDNGLFILNIGTTTRDLTIQEGDPMEINCTLSSSLITVSGRQVEADSTMLLLKSNGTRISNTKIRIMDELTIQYKVKRTTMKENGLYMCYFDPGLTDLKPVAVCATIVKIGLAPSEKDDFSFKCIGYDLKNFTCTWDPLDYNTATTYDLHLLIGTNYSFSACTDRNKQFCTFSVQDKSPYLISEKKLRFRLDVANKLGSISKIYEIDHYSNVVLGPVLQVKIYDIGTQNFSISWEPPRSILGDFYIENITEYSIKVIPSTWTKSTDSSDAIKSFIVKNIFQISIQDLVPFTTYRIIIRCRMKTDSGASQWSSPVELNETTLPDTPFYCPTFKPGGFEVVHKNADTRNIRIYFDPMNLADMHGPNLTYYLFVKTTYLPHEVLLPSETALEHSVYPPNSRRDSKHNLILSLSPSSLASFGSSSSYSKFVIAWSNELDTVQNQSVQTSDSFVKIISDPESFSYEVTNLNIETDYQLELRSHNSLGLSTGASYILIPREGSIYPKVDYAYAIDWGTGNYTLYWLPSSIDLVDYYIVYWCEIADADYCLSTPLNTQISRNQTTISLQLPEAKYKFGVSAIEESKGLSNGIRWASCMETALYLSTKSRFKRLDLTTVDAYSVKLAWKLDCPSLEFFIEKYQIHFCRIALPCSETLTIIDVSRNQFEFVIEKLEASTAYNFTVHAITYRGQSIESPMRTIETKLDSISLIVTILIIIGGIILILSVVYSLFICSMRKRKDQKELKKAVDSNWIPKMPSRLKGDANILLNPLCQETRNEYENKEYMNADSTNTTKFIAKGLNSKLKMEEAIANNGKNNVIILSTISGNQLNDVINKRSPLSLPSSSSTSSTSSSSSSSSTGSTEPDERVDSNNYKNLDGTNKRNILTKKERKSSDGCGCDSEDSGYSARLSDKHPYYRAASFNISSIIRSINEDSPYILPDTSSGIPIEKVLPNNPSTVTRSLSDSDLSYNDYTVITIDSPSNCYLPAHPNHRIDQKDVQNVSNGYVYG